MGILIAASILLAPILSARAQEIQIEETVPETFEIEPIQEELVEVPEISTPTEPVAEQILSDLDQETQVALAEDTSSLGGAWFSQNIGDTVIHNGVYAFYALGSGFAGNLIRTVRIKVAASGEYPYQLSIYGPCRDAWYGGGCGGAAVAYATTTSQGEQYLEFVLDTPVLIGEGYYALEIQTYPPRTTSAAVSFYGSSSDVSADAFFSSADQRLAADGCLEISGESSSPDEEDTASSNVLFLPGIKGSYLFSGEDELWLPSAFEGVLALGLASDGSSIDPGVYVKEGSSGILLSVAGTKFYDSFAQNLDALVSSEAMQEWRAVPYDWRLSLGDLVTKGAEVDGRIYYSHATSSPYIVQTLEELAASSKTGKVTIVAHSNGGLLAKHLLSFLGDERAQALVDRVVFVAVPHYGAPQSIGALLYGQKEALPTSWTPFLLTSSDARELAENMPMVYHLLPSQKYFDENGSVGTISGTTAYQTEYAELGETIDSFEELESFLSLQVVNPYAGEDYATNENLLLYGNEAHDSLDSWTPPEGVSVYQIVGTGLPTITGVEFYEQASPLTGAKKMYRPVFSLRGDGVVPVGSSLETTNPDKDKILDLRPESNALREEVDHGNILESSAVIRFVNDIILDSTSEYSASEGSSQEFIVAIAHSPIQMRLINKETSTPIDQTSDENVRYGLFGNTQYMIWDDDSNYRLEIEGLASGELSLDVLRLSNEPGPVSTFASIPVTPSMRASLDLEHGEQETASLSIQYEDGSHANSIMEASSGVTNFYEDSSGEQSAPSTYTSLSHDGGELEADDVTPESAALPTPQVELTLPVITETNTLFPEGEVLGISIESKEQNIASSTVETPQPMDSSQASYDLLMSIWRSLVSCIKNVFRFFFSLLPF